MTDWLQAVGQALEQRTGAGVQLGAEEIEELLDLAGYAAHESGARLNAPLVCYLVGRASAAGTLSITELSAVVRSVPAHPDREA